ncbi:hypothetical protein GEMRC1_011896 [Eukaryota sp. GEM-RC1]
MDKHKYVDISSSMTPPIPPPKMSRPSEDSGDHLIMSSNQSLDSPLTTLLHESFLKHLHFQESLLLLIQLHYLRRNLSGRLRYHLSSLIRRIRVLFDKAGYVSERFSESSFQQLR